MFLPEDDNKIDNRVEYLDSTNNSEILISRKKAKQYTKSS